MPSSAQQLRLSTPRLVVRPMTNRDAPALFRIFSEPEVTRYLSHRPWTNRKVARERWIVQGEVSDSDLYGLLLSDW